MTARYNHAILEAAGAHLGLAEWPGAKHNPEVIGFFNAVGHGWVKDDETPWCAAFVGAVLATLGLPHTGKLNARSYLQWGEKVHQSEALPGDVVIFSRGDPNGASGHVAFLVRFDGSDRVVVRGGNQGNKVSDASYTVGRVLGYRRATGQEPDGVPILRAGMRGVEVKALQLRLRELGYHMGEVDGVFGSLTRGAVTAFQADNGLDVDGAVGRETREALQTAQPRPQRNVDTADLRARGSETIKQGDVIDVGVAAGGLLTAAPAIKDALTQAQGILPTITSLVREQWPAIIVLVVLGAVWYANREVKKARLADARSGAHLGR
ncbi:TIGR02594 family protein [Sagittula salina]|uniref:TIGR02594 family protein n=1 Tax=Sagittula salina TaxID=2820268 RepID=A0A940MU38_9RHOB|nr:TIGR02594 family protein [Sagittula salina]MBP0484688.1 TIGR02594 family protein [Sagittula salina]